MKGTLNSIPPSQWHAVSVHAAQKALVRHTNNCSELDQAGEAARAGLEVCFPCKQPCSGVSTCELTPSLAQPLPFPSRPSLLGLTGNNEDGLEKLALLCHTATLLFTNCLYTSDVQCLLSSSHELKCAIANHSPIYQCNLQSNLLIKLPGKKLLMGQQIYFHFQFSHQDQLKTYQVSALFWSLKQAQSQN